MMDKNSGHYREQEFHWPYGQPAQQQPGTMMPSQYCSFNDCQGYQQDFGFFNNQSVAKESMTGFQDESDFIKHEFDQFGYGFFPSAVSSLKTSNALTQSASSLANDSPVNSRICKYAPHTDQSWIREKYHNVRSLSTSSSSETSDVQLGLGTYPATGSPTVRNSTPKSRTLHHQHQGLQQELNQYNSNDALKYIERRRKNNLAAKKSRDARRVRGNQLKVKVMCLENANQILRSQVAEEQELNEILRRKLDAYEKRGEEITSSK